MIRWDIERFHTGWVPPNLRKNVGEEYRAKTIMSKDKQHMNQAPTAAKFGTGMDFVSSGDSTDSAGSLLVGPDEGPGAPVACEELWLTLAFFFFLSKAVRPKLARQLVEGRKA